LENSLRQCELQGVEASAEIQTAARKVADENKKLRAMLVHNGIDNDSIEFFLTSSTNPIGTDYSPYGFVTSSSVQILEDSLNMRRKCCTDRPGAADGTTMAKDNAGYSGLNSTESPWNTKTPTEPSRFIVSQSGTPMSSSGSFEALAQTTISEPVSVTSNGTHRLSQNQPRSGPYVQSSLRDLVPKVISVPSDLQAAADNFQHSLLTPTQSTIQPGFRSAFLGETHTQSQHAPQSSSIYLPTTNHNLNVNNCSYAADMITIMAGADPARVRADLGCLPNIDCDVDNQIVFEVMDRYSNHAGI
jgi:hypothetical protein